MSTCPIVCAPNTWLSQLGSTWSPIHMNRDIPFSVSNKCPLKGLATYNKQNFDWIVRDFFPFFRAWCFPAFDTDFSRTCHFMFSRARQILRALGTDFMFFRTWHRFFARLARASCFPAFDTDFWRVWHFMLSCALHRFFARLARASCFPARGTYGTLWRLLRVNFCFLLDRYYKTLRLRTQ